MSDSSTIRLTRGVVWFVAGLSGAAGLGYEMVWTRLLGVALGTEMYAVLGVIAGLFGGLALGGFVLSGVVARSARPGRVYATLELVIAAWGLACTALLPTLADRLPAVLGQMPGTVALDVLIFLLPAIALLPATVAMGGTLAALVRCLDVGTDRPTVAGVYAANTVGAVAGTLLTVTVFFPALGLRGTLLALAAMNALAATLAWTWDGPGLPAQTRRSAVDRARAPLGLLVLFLTGLLGVGVEVLVMRAAAQFLSDTIYTFAGLLAAYLFGSALGGAVRQRVVWRASPTSAALLLSLTAVTVLLTLVAIVPLARMAIAHSLVDPMSELALSALLFVPCAFAMGALYADLLEQWSGRGGEIGLATGVNALGAALAPWLAAFVLIPNLGTMAALVWLAIGYVLLLSWRREAWRWAVLPLVLALALLRWPVDLPQGLPDGARQVASIEGPMVSASVVDDAGGARYLEVNGHFRMGGTSSERSDFRQALLPLLLHRAPHRALYLGVGTGATLAGAMTYPQIDVQGVEISAEVVALLRYFAVPGRPDPAEQVLVADARRFVAANRSRFDVIVADNFHPALEGSGSLYTLEHFQHVRDRLSPDGVFCQWLPLYQLDMRSLRDIVRTYLAVFPQGSAWLAHFSVRMPMLALCGHPGDQPISLQHVDGTLQSLPLQRVLGPIELDTPLAVAGTYLADADSLRRFVGAGDLNRDDRPIIALNGAANIAALADPPETQLLAILGAMRASAVPSLPVGGTTAASLQRYWRARDRFLDAGASIQGNPRGRDLIEAATPGLLLSIHESADFDPAYRPLLAMADALAPSDPTAARALLEKMVAAAPNRVEAMQRLRQLDADEHQGEKRIR